MEVLWNKLHLLQPLYRTWETTTKEFDTKQFLCTINKIIKDFEPLNILHTEAAILSRLIYRMKSKFRSDKGLKNMEKVNRALLNYLSVDIEKEYKNLKDCIEISSSKVTLPSRQFLEFVLVRTQGFAKLMCRIEWTTHNAAHFLKTRINLGHAWTMSVIAYSVISRIWILSRHIIQKSCNWYYYLYQYMMSFKIVGVPWLPKTYVLPRNLNEWLDLPWLNEKLTPVSTQEYLQRSIFNLIKLNVQDNEEKLNFDIEILDELPKPTSHDKLSIVQLDKKIETQEKDNIMSNESNELFDNTNDIGQPIQRRTFESVREKVSKKKKSLKKQYKVNEQSVIGKKKISKNVEKKEKTACKNLEKKFLKKVKQKPTKELLLSSKITSPTKQQKFYAVEDVKTKEDFVKLLNAESYHGLDKLQWNIVKNNAKKILCKIDKCNVYDKKKKEILLKKAIHQVQKWTS